METLQKELNWTTIGKEYHDSKKAIIREIETMEWVKLVDGMSLPFSQGEGIKGLIKEFKIPKVSHIAYMGRFSHYGDCLGLYGILGHYKNANVKLYFVDSGDCITPVCTEVFKIISSGMEA